MKKLLIVLIIGAAFLSSCKCSHKEEKSDEKTEAKTEVTASESTNNDKSYVKTMTYGDFIKKVWDIELSASNFAFKGSKPCVIDFYATWCGPCKKIAPIMEKLAKEYDGKVDFYKVDTDQDQKLSMILQVRNIPTVFFMKEGAQPEKSVGAKDEEYFRTQINKLLSE
jgi:thioredoxin